MNIFLIKILKKLIISRLLLCVLDFFVYLLLMLKPCQKTKTVFLKCSCCISYIKCVSSELRPPSLFLIGNVLCVSQKSLRPLITYHRRYKFTLAIFSIKWLYFQLVDEMNQRSSDSKGQSKKVSTLNFYR